jgi:hypothetical protein
MITGWELVSEEAEVEDWERKERREATPAAG